MKKCSARSSFVGLMVIVLMAMAMVPFVSRASAAIFDGRPIAAYSFDEGEGSTAEDATGNEHDGTIKGAGWTKGKFGKALEFDGDLVTIPGTEDLQLEEFTVEAWVRPDESSLLAPVVAKLSDEDFGYALYAGGDGNAGRPEGYILDGKEIDSHAVDGEALPLHAWSHIAVTNDGNKIRLYVNGELADTGWSSDVKAGGEGPLAIGGNEAFEEGEYFSGKIDEVRVYERALDEGEVANSMAPLPEVQTTEAYGVEDTEAIMLGTVDPRGSETSYVFQYGPTKAYGTTLPEEIEETVVGNEPREVEEVAEDLQPETTYHYRIVATSDAGTVVGQDQTLTTGAALISPQALQAQQASLLAEGKWEGFFNLAWSGKSLETGAELNMVEKSGAKMFRVAIGAPSGKTDEIFKLAAEKHITILPVLGGNKMMPQDKETHIRPAWKAEIEAIVLRYGHGGSFWADHTGIPQLVPDYWEIWNEPNYGANGNQDEKVDAVEYGDVLREAREVLQEKDDQAEILLGGLLTVSKKAGEVDHETVGEFIRDLDKAGYSGDYKALSLHPYAFKGDVKRVSRQVMRNIHIARGALDNAEGGQSKKIWVTEIGWPVGNPNDKKPAKDDHKRHDNDGHHIPVSQEKQKELLESVFQRIKEHSGSGPHGLSIEKVFYYNVQDNFYGVPRDWAMSCGLREDLPEVLVEVAGTVHKWKTNGHGKYRKSWFAFQDEAEFEGTFP
jgi:Concanavalin A-like lectin/glucanases superfamily